MISLSDGDGLSVLVLQRRRGPSCKAARWEQERGCRKREAASTAGPSLLGLVDGAPPPMPLLLDLEFVMPRNESHSSQYDVGFFGAQCHAPGQASAGYLFLLSCSLWLGLLVLIQFPPLVWLSYLRICYSTVPAIDCSNVEQLTGSHCVTARTIE